MKPPMASFTAYGPSAMGLTPAIAPAAKLATATGSVNLPASALISIAPITTPAAATAPTSGTSCVIVSVQQTTKRRGPIAVGGWNQESTITAAVAPAATDTGGKPAISSPISAASGRRWRQPPARARG